MRPSRETQGGAPATRLATPAARRGLAAVVVGALFIAFSPILVRVSEVGPTATGFYRTFLAVPLLAAWVTLDRDAGRGPVRHKEGGWRPLTRWVVLAGLLFAADLAAWHWSLAFTTVANSTFLANLAPVSVTLLAWLLFRERVTPLFLLGMVVAIAGASLMVRASVSLSVDHLKGDALALATSFFYAGYIVSIKGLRRRISTVRLMLYTSAVTSVALLPLAALAGEQLFPATPEGFLTLLALAWLSQALGQGLIAYGLAHVPAGFSSVSLLLQPPAAALLAWLLLAERITWWQAFGGAGVMVGIVLARAGSRPS